MVAIELTRPIVVVQSPSSVQLFVTPWTAAHQVSLSFTISQSLLNSCPLNRWWHPTISSSVDPFLLLPSIFSSPFHHVRPTRKEGFTKQQISWQLDSRSSQVQHCEKQMSVVYKPLSLWYCVFSSLNGPRQKVSTWILKSSWMMILLQGKGYSPDT